MIDGILGIIFFALGVVCVFLEWKFAATLWFASSVFSFMTWELKNVHKALSGNGSQ